MTNDENREMVTIPYFVHEGMIVRWERNFKIVLAMLIGTILLLFATNMVWIYYWSQFDISNEEVRVDSDGGGDANYIGRETHSCGYAEIGGTLHRQGPLDCRLSARNACGGFQ